MNEVAAIRSGDERAFAKVYRHYHAKLYVYFSKKTRSVYLTEELVQLSFIKLWNSRETLKEGLSVDVQLFRIARTTLIDLLRREAAARHHLQKLVQDLTVGEAVSDPHGSRDAEASLKKAIDSLSPVRRKIFLLSRQEGYSHKEIAEALKLKPKTVENQIARALRQLRQLRDLFSFFLY